MKTIERILILALTILAFEAHAYRELERVVNLRGYWKFNIGDNPQWADYDYDDQDWDEIFVPSPWENEGFHGYDGFAWYRVAFELDPFDISDDYSYYIDLGHIDDCDEVYINGELVGFTGGMPPNFYTAYNAHRLYHVPNEILNKSGYNTIAVRVYDTVLDGGIVSGTYWYLPTRRCQ